MSKAISEAALLEPEYRLIQAISDFEAQLSSQQKLLFGIQKRVIPNADDVMRFTAKIDKDISARGVRRVYGPRLTNFLDGVQKFVPLGDILIGTTPDMLGRSIWTVVRFSITATLGATNKHSSYIDKLSSIFMEAGRSVPRYHDMALLFPQSKKLQANLTEYYIVVVKLCHKILQMSRSSSFAQLWDSFSDPLQTFQSQLKTWSTAIKNEVLIQSIAMAKKEKDDSSRFQLVLQKDRAEKEIRRKQKIRMQFLDQCSRYDHVTTWKQTRKIGNTKLFVNDPVYMNWKSSSISSTLVYCGKLGAGKSVLLANIMDDLFLELKLRRYCITYFFCDHEKKESLEARAILGSFTRQMLQLHGSLDKISGLNRDNKLNSDSISSIVDLLDEEFKKPIYFVLDGLDECEAEQRNRVLSEVKALQKKVNLLFCISSRLEPNRTSKFEPHQLVAPKFSDIPEDNPEIADFIDCELKACMSSGRLKVMDCEIIATIKDVLLLGAQGMFLWVSLSIKALCGLPSDNDILEALANLPQKLTDLYAAILKKSLDSYKTYLDLVMRLMVAAIRPLSMQELRVALNVKPGELEWNGSTLVTDMPALLTSSGGLVIVDEEMHTVRFVHHSFRQFLTDPEISGPHCFLINDAERHMAQVLTTYLNYMCFDTRISTAVVPKIEGAPVVDNVFGSFGAIGRLINQSYKGADCDIGRILIEASTRSKSRQKVDLSLESYAREFWCQHSATVLDTDSLVAEFVHKLMEKDHKFVLNRSYVQDPLLWAAENEYLEAFSLLFDSGLTPNGPGLFRIMRNTLQEGNEKIIKRYLENISAVAFMSNHDKSCVPKRSWGYVFFRAAVQNKLVDIVKTLLERNSVNAAILNYSLEVVEEYACITGEPLPVEFAIVKTIIDSQKLDLWLAGVGQQSHHPDQPMESILFNAINNSRTDLVELLFLHKMIDLKFPALLDFGCSLLSQATANERTRIVDFLSSTSEIDIEEKDDSGNSPLHQAAMLGYKEIVSLLLAVNSEQIKSRNLLQETPLILASRYRHTEAARMLLEISYDQRIKIIDAVDKNNRTALSYAAADGNVEMIELLIKSSNVFLDVRVPDCEGRSALSYAAEFGAPDPIEILLSLQDNTWYEVDDYGRSPLDYCRSGRFDAKTLLRRTMDDRLRGRIRPYPLPRPILPPDRHTLP